MTLMMLIVPIMLVVFAAFVVMAASSFRQGRRIHQQANRVFDAALDQLEQQTSSTSGTNEAADYQCDHCGATIQDGAQVSPHGDVRCPYCHNWFNVHP